MTGAMEVVIFAVVAGAVVVGLVGVVMGGGSAYEEIGRGGLSLEGAGRTPPRLASPAGEAEQLLEMRQMLQAQAERRVRRGETPLDVEAEIRRRLGGAEPHAVVDDDLREEIRQLAIARNARRERRGEPPLDVDAQVARLVRELDA